MFIFKRYIRFGYILLSNKKKSTYCNYWSMQHEKKKKKNVTNMTQNTFNISHPCILLAILYCSIYFVFIAAPQQDTNYI